MKTVRTLVQVIMIFIVESKTYFSNSYIEESKEDDYKSDDLERNVLDEIP